jgi:hypothetical protein
MNALTDNTKELLRQLFGAPAPKPRLPLGRCACHEPTVRWCTRHGRPLGFNRFCVRKNES